MIIEGIKYILFKKAINIIGQLSCNLINAFEYMLCDFDLIEYLEASFVREVAIATAIGSLTFCAMLIIFVAQITGKNEEDKYNSQSAAIYEFCNLKFIIIINSLLILSAVTLGLSKQFHKTVQLVLLVGSYLLMLINIFCYFLIFNKSRQIIINDDKWLASYRGYHWNVIRNLILYHDKIVNQTPKNKEKVKNQIDNSKKENERITYCHNKIPYRKDEIFTLCSEQIGILRYVDIKQIINIVTHIQEIDTIFVDIYANFDDGIEIGTKLVMFRTNIHLRDEEKYKIEQEILSKKIELHKCFEIYPIQTLNAINSFKYLYANKLIVNYSDTYIFNFLLHNALYEMHARAIESSRYSVDAYKNFLNVYFYNLILISESNSRYAFCRNCDFLIDLFYGSGNNLKEWSEDEYVENLIKIFYNSKHKYDFIHGFTIALLYLLNSKSMHSASTNILSKCWFRYSDYIIVSAVEENDNVNKDYNVLKFHFNSIVIYNLAKLKDTTNVIDGPNAEESSAKNYIAYIDYCVKSVIDGYFKNFSIFDYLSIMKEDSDLIRNFTFINNYGFDQDKARYDILIKLFKYCEPDVHYGIKDIRAHFDDIKTYRFKYITEELKQIDGKYRKELKEFIRKIIKNQIEAEYKQEYLDNFNNHFNENLVSKSNITLMHIYLKILQDNNQIIMVDNIDNCIIVPYNKLIFKNLYTDDLWAVSECSSIAYSICYDLDKELLKYFCDNAIELIDNIDFNDFVCISTFDADIKFEYRVRNDELKIGNQYYKYLFVKKDGLPELLWPNNPKFDLNIGGELNDVVSNKNIDRKLGLELNEENIGRMIIYNSPKLKYKENVVIYKSRALHKK